MAICNVIKPAYNSAEWTARENYYIQELDKLEIPVDASSPLIRELAARIDKLRSEANIELAYQSRKFESLDRTRKATEKELFLLLKSQKLATLKTIDDVNGAVAIAMKDIPSQDVLLGKGFQVNMNAIVAAVTPQNAGATANILSVPTTPGIVSLTAAIMIAQERTIFMEHVLSALKDKASSLITIEGGLKLEADVGATANRSNNMTGN